MIAGSTYKYASDGTYLSRMFLNWSCPCPDEGQYASGKKEFHTTGETQKHILVKMTKTNNVDSREFCWEMSSLKKFDSTYLLFYIFANI